MQSRSSAATVVTVRSAAAAGEVTAVLDDLRRIVRALRQSSRAAERQLGVSGAQLFVLQALAGAGALSLNDLAARTRTDQSTVSTVVARLVKAGLVSRKRSAEDGRRVDLQLTPRGRALLRRAPLAAQDQLIEGLDRMPRSQRRSLAIALGRLVDAMHLRDDQPAMFFEEAHPTTTPPRKGASRARS
jgi:DNA-binding MarR family transcriptional regulator